MRFQSILQEISEHVEGDFRAFSRRFQSIFKEISEHFQGDFGAFSGDFRAFSGDFRSGRQCDYKDVLYYLVTMYHYRGKFPSS